MPLVKSEVSQEKNLSVGFYSLTDIEHQAAALVDQARGEARHLIEQAKVQSRAILETAAKSGKQQGFVIGLEQGLKQGKIEGKAAAVQANQEKLRELGELLYLTTQQVEGYLQMLQAQAPRDVMKLAIEIARRTARISGRYDPTTLRTNVEGAVRLLMSKSKARILVNPIQHHLMLEIMEDLRVDVPQFENAQVISDDQIAPGGCRIICGEGEVDADLDRQIDRIAAEILPELASLARAVTPDDSGDTNIEAEAA